MSSIDIARTWRLRVGERAGEARWVRPALFVLLAAPAVAYTWNLSASGYANSFYAAAVQAGTESWKALFFGSLDSSSFITVDKPPASLWVMAISGRIFGFSSWSMLVPQALEGVAAPKAAAHDDGPVVVQVMRAGYQLKSKVLRPAMVFVGA